MLAPPTLMHPSPEQQSAEAVQTWPSGEHSCAGWQMLAPPSTDVQLPAQHSADAAQVVPLDLHTPASGVTPPSPAGGMGCRHANVVDSSPIEAAHCVPAQQVVLAPPSVAAQLAPSGAQIGTTAQVRPMPPSPLGRHGEPPQH